MVLAETFAGVSRADLAVGSLSKARARLQPFAAQQNFLLGKDIRFVWP